MTTKTTHSIRINRRGIHLVKTIYGPCNAMGVHVRSLVKWGKRG